MLLGQLLGFRLCVETLLELHQLGLEGVSVGQHVERPAMVSNLLLHAVFTLFCILVSRHDQTVKSVAQYAGLVAQLDKFGQSFAAVKTGKTA